MITSHSEIDHKKTLLALINYYKRLIKKGTVKPDGAAYKRMRELIQRYHIA